MVEDITKFLSEIGIKTKNYEYLNYEPTFVTDGSTETVKINNKDIPLNKKYLNYQYLETFLFGYGLTRCLNQLKKDEGNYSTLFYDATLFLGDILKYNNKILPEYNDLVESLIIRTMNIVNDKSAKLFNKYDRDIKDAEFNIANTLKERQLKTLEDAENNRMVSFSVYPSNGIFTKGALVSIASSSLVNVGAEMNSHAFSANTMREITRSSAKSTLDSNLYELLSDELSRFALNYEDMLVKKRTDVFESINYRSSDIIECPYKYELYLENEKFKESDFPSIKKLLEFYNIKDDFINDIEYFIKSKIYESIDEDKGEYKGINLELYYYLTGKKSLKENKEITEDLFSSYYAELKSFAINEYITNKEDVKEAKELFEKIKKNQSYFTEEQLNELNKLVKRVKLAQKKDQKELRKNNKKRKKLIITLTLIVILVVASIILYYTLGEEKSVEIIAPVIGVLFLGFLFLKVRKAKRKVKDYFKY